jgi:hypothetical protein
MIPWGKNSPSRREGISTRYEQDSSIAALILK